VKLATHAPGFGALPVSWLHAARVDRLPWHHRDPFDRMLIAQALAESLVFATSIRPVGCTPSRR
jgi:PIN domain nuclease of toxin-antitoxin system